MRPVALVALVTTVAAAALCGCNYMRHPTDATTWGKPEDTMVLGLEARGDVINAFLQNRDGKPRRVIARGVTVKLTRMTDGVASGEATSVADSHDPVHLDRDDSFETLAPAEYLATPIPVPKLAPGTYEVTATYTAPSAATAKAGDWWIGTVTAGPITYVVE
jgi:hypothetical protein